MEDYYDFEDVLIKPNYSRIKSRADVNLKVYLPQMEEPRVPIIASNMVGVGTPLAAGILNQRGWLTALRKVYDEDAPGAFRTYGLNDPRILNAPPQEGWIMLDVANGYLNAFIEYAVRVRRKHPKAFIIAGNVATPNGALSLWNAGANAVKVGIGSGGVCTTRIQAGVGVPQFSAVRSVSNARPSSKYYVISDGGCRTPGDVAKAFVAGADLVMLGSMLSGYEETGLRFYGNASAQAMSIDSLEAEYRHPEGRIVHYDYDRGPLEESLLEIEAGLRSACSYTGSEHPWQLRLASVVPVRRQYNHIKGDEY